MSQPFFLLYGFFFIKSAISTVVLFVYIKWVCNTNKGPNSIKRPFAKINVTPGSKYPWVNSSYFLIADEVFKSWNKYDELTIILTPAIKVQKRKQKKYLCVLRPTQFAIQGQWWSILITHSPHLLQWCVLGGLIESHLLQNLKPVNDLFSVSIYKRYWGSLFKIVWYIYFSSSTT